MDSGKVDSGSLNCEFITALYICNYIYIYIYIYVCISYNTGKSALSDIYAQCPRTYSAQVQVRIYQGACAITNMLPFRHSKILCSASL